MTGMLLSSLRLYYPKKKKEEKNSLNNTHTRRNIFHSFTTPLPPPPPPTPAAQNKKNYIVAPPTKISWVHPEYMFLTGSTFAGRTLLSCLSICLFHFAHSTQESRVWWSCISISMGTTMEWRDKKYSRLEDAPILFLAVFLKCFYFSTKPSNCRESM